MEAFEFVCCVKSGIVLRVCAPINGIADYSLSKYLYTCTTTLLPISSLLALGFEYHLDVYLIHEYLIQSGLIMREEAWRNFFLLAKCNGSSLR